MHTSSWDEGMSQKHWLGGEGIHFRLVRHNEPLLPFGRGDLKTAGKNDGNARNPNYLGEELLPAFFKSIRFEQFWMV